MGLLSYIAPAKSKKQDAPKATQLATITQEKTPQPAGTPLVFPSALNTPWNAGTPTASRPGSIYHDNGQSRDLIRDMKCDIMVNWLHQQQMEWLWTTGGFDEGAVLKKSRGQYACCPENLADNPEGLFKAIQNLNVRCAITVSTNVIKLFLGQFLQTDSPLVPLGDGLYLQILPNVSYLPACQKHHFAAFIADTKSLVVWDDEPTHLLDRAKDIQQKLMNNVWQMQSEEVQEDGKSEKFATVNVNEVDGVDDVEAANPNAGKARRIVLNQSVATAFTLALCIICIGTGYAEIAQEIYIDRSYTRLAFVLVLPAQIWLALFFFQAICGNIAQIIGPVNQVHENTKTYSGIKSPRLKAGPLPHVTVQMPVYKEGLKAVIEPTIYSIKAAISTYEMQGGTANIFINDDGMQLIPEEEARARQDFYEEHNIGWVARPRHDPRGEHGEPFVRRGKFKKASNMNYALWASNRIEEKLSFDRPTNWTQEDEAQAYQTALSQVVEEDEGRTWADGNIRLGDYILLIDSDTRVPNDCFLDTVSELEQSPQVAIIQMNTGVMNVTDSFFEKGITFFTNLVYTQIRYAVANGDVAPFVGHNAFLRWSAVQSIGYEDEDRREKFWSESTVSEDFDMALRLQSAGYILRYAAYFGDGFEEGVSLTVYDELARWEKYAYGCNELIFHPVKHWLTKGPFTPLFRRFIVSCIPLPSKITILAYIGTYYALGSAWILTLANYFLIGLFNGWLDHFYLDSMRVYYSIIVVFTALGNVSLAVLRYRTGEHGNVLKSFITNLTWIPLMTIFLGGVSMHVSQALLCHMFGIDMNWGATSKEVENTTFFQEVPKVIKNFKYTFALCLSLIALMVVMAMGVPPMWRIDLLIAIYPLGSMVACHLLLPIALNPSLMLFTF